MGIISTVLLRKDHVHPVLHKGISRKQSESGSAGNAVPVLDEQVLLLEPRLRIEWQPLHQQVRTSGVSGEKAMPVLDDETLLPVRRRPIKGQHLHHEVPASDDEILPLACRLQTESKHHRHEA